MRIMFSVNSRVLTIETSRVVETTTADTDPPAIFDVSRAETQVRPQWDHDGPRPTALGFQPNGVMSTVMHSYDSGGDGRA